MDKLRIVIDQIDDQIMALLEQRMQIVEEVKAYKISNHLPVVDVKRENEILAKTKKYRNAHQIETVYKQILIVSKEMQR